MQSLNELFEVKYPITFAVNHAEHSRYFQEVFRFDELATDEEANVLLKQW